MNLQVAVLCDAATDYNGKLSLLGAFDTIIGSEFPLVHRHCALALRMSFANFEEGTRTLELRIVDEDGTQVIKPVSAELDIRVPGNGLFATRNIILNFEGLKFSSPGQYSIDLYLDGTLAAGIALQILKVNRPATPSPEAN